MRASNFSNEVDERAPRAPLQRSLAITHAGLTLGSGTILARIHEDMPARLAIEGEEERILALISAALGKTAQARIIGNLQRASEQWARGDKCLAHFHLAFAGLPQIDETDAARLALAGEALAKGASPAELLKALGLDGDSLDARKFNPDQPHVPAGNGREGGRWTSSENGPGDDGPLHEGRSVAAGGERREDEAERAIEEEKHSLGIETEGEEVGPGARSFTRKRPRFPSLVRHRARC